MLKSISAQGVAQASPGAQPGLNAIGSSSFPGAGNGLYNFTAQNTIHIRGAAARVRSNTGTAKLAFMGDSTSMGVYANGNPISGCRPYCLARASASILNGRFNGGGIPPWAQSDSFFGNSNAGSGSTYTTYDSRVVFTGVWTIATQNNVGWNAHQTTASGAILAFTPNEAAFDTIDVYVQQYPGLGSFNVNINGGATLQTINTSGASATVKYTIACTAGTAGANTINCVNTSANQINIVGIACRLSTRRAFECYNLGVNGAKAADLFGTNGPWSIPTTLPQLGCDGVFINAAINDIENLPTTIATYSQNIQIGITAALAGPGDVILVAPTPCSGTAYAANAQSYINALYTLAQTNNIPLIDMNQRWVNYATTNAVMPYGDQGNNPALHPSYAGYADMASSYMNVIPF